MAIFCCDLSANKLWYLSPPPLVQAGGNVCSQRRMIREEEKQYTDLRTGENSLRQHGRR
jgi:hypothetical protein